ncbi:MAG TPA: hypothetical protein VNZ61_02580 [Roseomonas sp.]|nr:hypothetical protein [Roseomonas sp.]
MDHVALLREALEPELAKLLEVGLRVLPGLDGATLGSLLTIYGIEIGLGTKAVGREQMADYLRLIAETLEQDDGPLPTLSGLPPVESEPAF